jgi:hypothetical protein
MKARRADDVTPSSGVGESNHLTARSGSAEQSRAEPIAGSAGGPAVPARG